MIDRLGDLREVAKRKNVPIRGSINGRLFPLGEALTSGNDGNENDAEAAVNALDQSKPSSSEFMGDYFAHIKRIKDDINELQKNVHRVTELKNDVVRATSAEKEREISTELDTLLSETNKHITIVKKSLERMKKDNETFSQENQTSSETRIRDNMHQALTRKFRELLEDYRCVQTDYQVEVQSKVARQIQIGTHTHTAFLCVCVCVCVCVFLCLFVCVCVCVCV
eukprot:GHVR01060643.1.p1 GENE.GHVR01060643.1~~GHVR01060643.1.p1  ORF type:complete len:224 (-),score=78.30 GHVR01060643.1:2-673(-)